MNCYLVFNPRSGGYAPGVMAGLQANLRTGGLEPVLCEACTPQEIHDRYRTIFDEAEAPLIIIAGGDGTINAVINQLRPAHATLAVVPLGTSNVLARELGISSVEDAAGRIVAGKTRVLPAGVLRLEEGEFRFLLMAGIGVDGTIVRDVSIVAKRRLKQGAYALSAIGVALKWERSMLELEVSGKATICHSAVISRSSRYAGDFIFAPGRDLFARNFTVTCLTRARRADYLRLAFDLFLGRAPHDRNLVRFTCNSLQVRGNKPIQIDGDFIGNGPAEVAMLPDFARIIV